MCASEVASMSEDSSNYIKYIPSVTTSIVNKRNTVKSRFTGFGERKNIKSYLGKKLAAVFRGFTVNKCVVL